MCSVSTGSESPRIPNFLKEFTPPSLSSYLPLRARDPFCLDTSGGKGCRHKNLSPHRDNLKSRFYSQVQENSAPADCSWPLPGRVLINNLNLQILFQLLWNLNCPSEACFFQNNSTVIFTASIILCKIDNPVSGKAVPHTWKAAQLPGCWRMNGESRRELRRAEWKTEFSSEISSYILLHLRCTVHVCLFQKL